MRNDPFGAPRRRREDYGRVFVILFSHVSVQPMATYMAKALKPPSTTATVPVTNLAASLMR